MRKFKVVYQKNTVILNQLSLSVETKEIEAHTVQFENEWLLFFKDVDIPVLALQRAIVFTVEEITEDKN